ncbi:MAG: hypothetical protein EBR33_12970 [Synechococcaceae bacterium WB4_1_0192]|nr:hypothetical protein [Synechococcaceae bacterium WB4_1_0192]
MAAFPAIEPLNRDYDLGAHITSSADGQNGDAVFFLHSILATDIGINLAFRALTSSQAQQIRDHYSGQRGTVRSFPIPAELWRTHADLYDVATPGTEWRYAGPLEEQRLDGGLFDVTVSLVSAIP